MPVLKLLPVTFKSKVVSGKLPELDKKLFAWLLENCEGKTLNLTLDYYVKKRSNAQNAYYWPVIIEYVLEGLIDAGYRRESLSPELVHDYLKGKFLKHLRRRVVNKLTKQYLTRQPSTAELTTWEFMDYMDGIRIWAAEFLSISIPDPNKEWKSQAQADYIKALVAGLITEDERNRVRIALKVSLL